MCAKISYSPNRFLEYHNWLKENNPHKLKEQMETVCKNLSIHERTYYRIIKTPLKISNANKYAIAAAFQLPTNFLFPEMEN